MKLPAGNGPVGLRDLAPEDLERVAAWLRQPHVARWWLPGTSLEAELAKIASRVVAGEGARTHMLAVTEDDRPIGWAQWYRWADYPAEAAATGAEPGDIGLDYAIGEPEAIGRGVGRAMIAALVLHVRGIHPGAGILVGPEAANRPSCAVLAGNGFRLLDVRPLVTEPTDAPIALYRLAGTSG